MRVKTEKMTPLHPHPHAKIFFHSLYQLLLYKIGDFMNIILFFLDLGLTRLFALALRAGIEFRGPARTPFLFMRRFELYKRLAGAALSPAGNLIWHAGSALSGSVPMHHGSFLVHQKSGANANSPFNLSPNSNFKHSQV